MVKGLQQIICCSSLKASIQLPSVSGEKCGSLNLLLYCKSFIYTFTFIQKAILRRRLLCMKREINEHLLMMTTPMIHIKDNVFPVWGSSIRKTRGNINAQKRKILFSFDIHVTAHRDKFLITEPTRCTNFSKFYFWKKLYMFRTVPLSIIRSFPL